MTSITLHAATWLLVTQAVEARGLPLLDQMELLHRACARGGEQALQSLAELGERARAAVGASSS